MDSKGTRRGEGGKPGAPNQGTANAASPYDANSSARPVSTRPEDPDRTSKASEGDDSGTASRGEVTPQAKQPT